MFYLVSVNVNELRLRVDYITIPFVFLPECNCLMLSNSQAIIYNYFLSMHYSFVLLFTLSCSKSKVPSLYIYMVIKWCFRPCVNILT